MPCKMDTKNLLREKQKKFPAVPVVDRWHSSITSLPLNKFIDCQVDGDLSALIISGSPSPEQLAEAWAGISQEYADETAETEYKMYLQLLKEVVVMEINLAIVENCVTILRLAYVKKCADQINALLFINFAFDPSNREKYLKDLDRAISRSKGSIKLPLQVKKSRLEAMEQRFSEKGRKPDRAYFQYVLNALSDYAKYLIPDTITVYQFCDRIRRLDEYLKHMEQHNNQKRLP